jgi:hypothetical protein
VSYHETYEFFAIDRRLTTTEMHALRAISTRATITPTRFYNFYDWGGLKADPRELVRRYFDLFLYTEQTTDDRWAMLRFPADRIDRRVWRTYVAETRSAMSDRSASIAIREKVLMLTLFPPEHGEQWRGGAASGNAFDSEVDEVDDVEVDEGSLAVPLALGARRPARG